MIANNTLGRQQTFAALWIEVRCAGQTGLMRVQLLLLQHSLAFAAQEFRRRSDFHQTGHSCAMLRRSIDQGSSRGLICVRCSLFSVWFAKVKRQGLHTIHLDRLLWSEMPTGTHTEANFDLFTHNMAVSR